ncbi:hypothetical protein BN1356_00706 [Streptococcus varani]|uniref:Uncharacterized protein n=1 Tax=Streptococcus varani TaxID=1608583 RepID=A0A0E4H796_9STRE|nr:hypothetical protein BN1356_00706 [Streptococcus varani]
MLFIAWNYKEKTALEFSCCLSLLSQHYSQGESKMMIKNGSIISVVGKTTMEVMEPF